MISKNSKGFNKIVLLVIVSFILLAGCTAKLHRAITEGDVTEAQRLIGEGRTDIEKESGKKTPLILAAERGQLEVVVSLIQAGAEINHANRNRYTSLMAACMKGDKQIVEFLLKRGADIYVQNSHGETPMVIACRFERKKILPLLINAGSGLEEKDVRGWTPLIYAVTWQDMELINDLLDKGADINYRISNRFADFDIYYNEDTPLHVAAFQGDIKVTRLLLDRGAKVNVNNRPGHSPLYHAVDNDHLDLIKLLIQAGARPFRLEETADDIYITGKLHKFLAMDYEKNGDLEKARKCFRLAADNFDRATPLLLEQAKTIASERTRAKTNNVLQVVGAVLQVFAALFGESDLYIEPGFDLVPNGEIKEMNDLQVDYRHKSKESRKSALECRNILLYLQKQIKSAN